MQQIRGNDISMIFQEPLNAFNPVYTIGFQIEEVLTIHTSLNKEQRAERLRELILTVGLPEPDKVINQYPHQLSGGMRQRAMIACAIAADPQLIIADEPTSSLDVTLQANIMALFKKLTDEHNISILLITHDLGMVQNMSDQINIMAGGTIVESGVTEEVINHPQDSYTKELLTAF